MMYSRISRRTVRISAISCLFLILVGGLIVTSNQAAAGPVCYDATTRGNRDDCGTGNVCVGGVPQGECAPFALDLTSPAVTESSSIVTPETNADVQPSTIQLQTCVGSAATCQTPSTRPTFWTSSVPFTPRTTVVIGGLRSGRTYDIQYYGTFNGGTDNATQSYTTWPGYGFTPTNSDAGCDGATSLCKRNISWTTPFAGDSTVHYSLNAPTWAQDFSADPALNTFSYLASLSSGQVWGVTYQGQIHQRSVSGAWSRNPFSSTQAFRGIDFINPNEGWVVGDNGLTAHTTNGGGSWQTVPLPSSATTRLYAVSMGQSGVVWATGEAQKIYRFTGTTWTQVYSDAPPQIFWSILSLNNQEAFAAGTSGEVIKTLDGGTSWQTTTLPGASGSTVYSLSSIDGKTIWAAGSNGKLWRTTDTGQNWVSIGTGIIAQITKVVAVSPKEIWFSSKVGIGHSMNGDAATPSFSIDAGVSSILSDIISMTVTTNTEVIVAGNGTVAAYSLCHPLNCSSSVFSSASTTNHLSVLSGLDPNRQYYYSAETFGSNVGVASFGTFTTPVMDSIKPTVTISPLAPFTNTCPLTVNGTAADTSPGVVQSVRVSLGSTANPVTATGTTSWSASFPCTQVVPGSNTVTAISNDGTNDSLPVSANFIFDPSAPTITISAPSPVTTSTITVSGTAGDAVDQVSKIELLVNGTGARINVPFTQVGSSISWSLGGVNLNPGVNTIVAYATDRAGNEGSAATNVTYNTPTFSISADAPTSQTVPAGTAAIFPIRLTSVSGFTGTVTMSATVSPSGMVPLFTPQQVSLATQPYDYTSMIVPSAAGGASGPYTITVSGTNGTITKTTQVTLSLTVTPDFTLSVSPASRTVVAGNQAVYDLTVSGSSTYVNPGNGITWSTGSLPSGVTATFGAMTGRPDNGGTGIVKLTLTPSVDVPPGTSITVIATDGNVSHSVTVGLTATPAPDFSLTIAPSTAATVAGSNNPGAYNLTVKGLNGFGGIVRLGLSSTPTDSAIRAVFSQNDFTPTSAGDVVTVNVTADNTVQCAPVPPPPSVPSPCNYALTITGTSGTPPNQITKTVSATLAVTPDTKPPVISGATASASDLNVTISWSTDEPANSRFDLYADAAHQTWIGFKEVNVPYCLSGCHVLSYDQVLTPLTTYYYTITSTDQAYPNGNTATSGSDANGAFTFTTQAAPDNTAPRITINSPAGGTSVRGLLTIAGQAIDDNPMSQVKLSITGPAGAASLPNTTIDCTSGTTCPFSLPWNTLNANTPNGDYALTVVALSSTGPAFTATVIRTFTIDNDTTPPTIECLSGQTVCEPVAIGLTCTGGSCSVTIHWRTNEDSTSEVEYGLAVDCSQQVRRPDGTFVSCAYTNAKRYDDVNDNSAGGLPNYTDHNVTLNNLAPDQLYHYRVTSCNISNLCTN